MNVNQRLTRASRVYGFVIVCALGALLGACARQAPAAQGGASTNAAELFDRACAKCHGQDGSGGLPMIANGPKPIDLGNPEWQNSRADDEIVAAIRDGRGAMPPFADVLSGDQIALLAGYVRQFGRSSGR